MVLTPVQAQSQTPKLEHPSVSGENKRVQTPTDPSECHIVGPLPNGGSERQQGNAAQVHARTLSSVSSGIFARYLQTDPQSCNSTTNNERVHAGSSSTESTASLKKDDRGQV
jgi:hypothetical protein